MTTPQVAPGFARLYDPRVFGTFIGASGASVFVHVNRVLLDKPWPVIALIAWIVMLAIYVVTTLVIKRYWLPMPEVKKSAGFIYLGSIVAMIAVIWLATQIIPEGKEHLRVAVIIIAVGLHFLPFSRAFHEPFHTRLAWVMTAWGVIALILGFFWAQGTWAVAVITGLTMLGLMSSYAWGSRERRHAGDVSLNQTR